ncbi:pleckstrin homology domain-containing family O member 2 [Trematomus bernacchii]|uniref:pleckstrin homology domain-containing family O member 2 n=1 Tax=Trematomus bernacchii TaxID=40690 RepID=UPI00146EC979|nr:pleckstrin homology domain-containing family O member 2 [Trematomus bernacchii]
MEDGAKEEPARRKEPKFLGKEGWVKKAPGRLLASYKERYVHVEKTEIVVYENEDLKNCLERLDLENYDKCHELKSPFKKKHRLILIRSSKPGNKVHDVKFQAQNAEDKEAWIKALLNGINRAKNKIFDEVTVDESINLEHVTRTRPKGNRNRRPPTRIHMKEVADVSSDGILRLDLDLENALMPNGTQHSSVDGTETPREAIKASTPPSNAGENAEKREDPEDEAQTEPEVSPQKKVIKPPMPPTKEAKPNPTPEDEPDKEEGSEKKVLKPPMPPSKEAKPTASPEDTEEGKAEQMSEKTPDARKKTVPPPTPPNKPGSCSSISNLAEASHSHPPTPPSKEKKPSVEPDQEVEGTTDEDEENEESDKKEATGTAVETDLPISKEAPPKPGSPSADWQVFEEESGETISNGIKASENDPQIPTEQLRKNSSPPPTPKKKPAQPNSQQADDKTTVTQAKEGQDPAASLQTDTSASSPEAVEAPPKIEVPSVVVSLNTPLSDGLSLSPLLCHLPGEKKKKKKAEEKSVDSGQHSDDDSEGSGNEDTLAASTAALRGSNPGLDVLDASEDEIQVPVTLKPTKAPPKPQVKPKFFPCRRSEPPPPSLSPSTKARSASIGDLLSDSSVCVQAHTAVAGGNAAPGDDFMKLETEVALEMEKTQQLLSRVSKAKGGADGDGVPEDLLAKAMEKLKKADHVLREVHKLKVAKDSRNRNSW